MRNMRNWFFLVLILLCSGSLFGVATTWYVHESGPDGSGDSWANAATNLYTIMQNASMGDDIWVAQGTYYPDGGANRSNSFQLKDNMRVYGGFSGDGWETSVSDRDFRKNVTILSGDIDQDWSPMNNSYHVVKGADGALLDGFTITWGYAENAGPDGDGAGMFNSNVSPTVRNCIFMDNWANDDGGGMFNAFSSVKIENCSFVMNGADLNGGGIANSGGSPEITNCIFIWNWSGNRGGGVNSWTSTPQIINCTFSSNNAMNQGGGISTYDAAATVTNCILWNNWAGANPEIAKVGGSGNNLVYNCDILGSFPGGIWDPNIGSDMGGNFDTDPRFYDEMWPDGPDGIFATKDDGLRLRPGSPCIDSGTGSGAPSDDILAVSRPQDSGIDLGAYEGTYPVIRYVDEFALGMFIGTSWTDAYVDLQSALWDAEFGWCDEIWVADGTYYPSITMTQTDTFQLVSNVGIYGGFEGSGGLEENKRSQRNWYNNITSLHGDIDGNGMLSGNSYHVVTGANNTVLDGFTIEKGNANGLNPYDTGAGLYNNGTSPQIANCTFYYDYAVYGGGMGNINGASPSVVNCLFNSNEASNLGGAIYNQNASSPIVKRCAFSGNWSGIWGGGIVNDSLCSPVVNNCVFYGNSSDGNGGAINNFDDSFPSIMNCTFYNNSAASGGAVFNNFNSNAFIVNSIMWSNTPENIFNIASGNATISYSDVQGSNGSGVGWNTAYGTDNGNNIDMDPVFFSIISVLGPDAILGTSDDGLRLIPGSPCIDTGTASGAPPRDILGVFRPQNSGYDRGAYEYDGGLPLSVLTVTIPGSATEGDGTLSGDVSIPVQQVGDLTVSLFSSDESEVTVASPVTIFEGSVSASFSMLIVDDIQVDGAQLVTITAQASGYDDGDGSITVYDNDGDPPLMLDIPASATEGDGIITDGGTVSIASVQGSDLVISLSSLDTTEVTVTDTVTIQSGDTSATFDIRIINDTEVDGTQSVTVTASAGGWADGIDIIDVYDDENDSDLDGMDDTWEINYFGTITVSDGSGDYDNDDLNDLDEYLNNTNPTESDTDFDGIPDGWEVDNGLDPLGNDANEDPDGDGLTNLEEYEMGTDPWEKAASFFGFDGGCMFSEQGGKNGFLVFLVSLCMLFVMRTSRKQFNILLIIIALFFIAHGAEAQEDNSFFDDFFEFEETEEILKEEVEDIKETIKEKIEKEAEDKISEEEMSEVPRKPLYKVPSGFSFGLNIGMFSPMSADDQNYQGTLGLGFLVNYGFWGNSMLELSISVFSPQNTEEDEMKSRIMLVRGLYMLHIGNFFIGGGAGFASDSYEYGKVSDQNSVIIIEGIGGYVTGKHRFTFEYMIPSGSENVGGILSIGYGFVF